MTSSIKWEPFEDLRAIYSLAGRTWARLVPGKPAGLPLMDLCETADAFVIEMDAPGIRTESVDVSVEGTTLCVKVDRRGSEEKQYLLRERPTGQIERTITLPDAVNPDGIQARLEDGVLVLTMPKRAEAKEVKIGVTAA